MAEPEQNQAPLTPEEREAEKERQRLDEQSGHLDSFTTEAAKRAAARRAAAARLKAPVPGGTAASTATGGAARTAAAGGARAGLTDAVAETVGTTVASTAAEGATSAAASAAGSSAASALGVAGAVVGEAKNVAGAIRDRDGVGVVDSGIRAAAVGAASAFGTPLASAAVGVAVNTKAGRGLTRGVSWLLVGAVGVVLFIVATIVVVPVIVTGGAVATLVAGASSDDARVGAFDGLVCTPIAETPYDDPTDKPNNDDFVVISEDGKSCTINLEGIDPRYVLAISPNSAYRDAGAYPNAALALNRAFSAVGNAGIACSDGMCYRMCDGFAGWVWGYDNSGYYSAQVHWDVAVSQGVAHPGSKDVPIGALLFWSGGLYGHVATYVGNGMVVSNVTGGPGGSNIYLMGADTWDRWKSGYLGWAEPIFRGAKIPDSGFWE